MGSGLNPGANTPPPVYLDWNATTPLHPEVVSAMLEASQWTWGNPSSVHGLGRYAKERIECVRADLARSFHVHPRDVLFTSGGTEANNLALLDAPAIITSRIEHPSVTRAAETVHRLGRPVHWLGVTADGGLNLEELDEALGLSPSGCVVAIQAANQETGILQPLAAISEITARRGAFLHVDAVQAAGKLAPEQWLHGDSFAIAAHKLRGPKGLGALLWRCGRPAPKPLLRGGSQQRGFRPGTLDPISILGFGAAWKRLHAGSPELSRLESLRDRLEHTLSRFGESNISSAADAGGCRRLGHVLSLFVPNWPGEELVAALDLEGICISSGSACSAGTAEPSPVITAMLGAARAERTVRISLGETTSEDDVERAARAFERVLSRA
ncbi:MAG: cysteine desulfurase family protein [Polyangiaceae bacterium]